MSQKELPKTVEQFKEEYLHSPERKKELKESLIKFGIVIPEEELDNIEVLKENHSLLTVRNLKTREKIISSVLIASHFDCCYNEFIDPYCGALIRVEHPRNCMIEETYYSSKETYILDLFKSQQYLQEYTTLSRAYRNFATKYGIYCILIENAIKNVGSNIFAPGLRIALYKKNKIPNESESTIDYNRDCLFQIKIKNNMSEEYSFVGNAFGNTPPDYVMEYQPVSGTENDHLFSSYVKSMSFCGLIAQNGSLNVFDNNMFKIPMPFNTLNRKLIFTDDEEKPHTSKAYFAVRGKALSILKDGNVISVKYLNSNNSFDWNVVSENKISSTTNSPFTTEDIERIINIINGYENLEDFKAPVIRSLTGYIRIHIDSDLNKKRKISLANRSFESLVEIIKKEDVATLSKRVENGLFVLSDIFATPIYELLGMRKEEFKGLYLKQQ